MQKQRPVRAKKKTETQRIKPVEGATQNHKDYLRSIAENDVTFCYGPSGTGKSYMSAGMCAAMLHRGDIDKVIITRPIVSAGRDVGAMPGDMDMKLAPYILPMQEYFTYFLGQAFYGHYINNKQIEFRPLELMRGATFDRTFMILDEAQNCTDKQIKLFLTRLGKDSKMVINGDTMQTDIAEKSGLLTTINKLAHIEQIGAIKMERSDIMRNGLIARILEALEG
jgi:phosphate starvation-inducible PhoH-like protein